MAVQVISYELRLASIEAPSSASSEVPEVPPATSEEMEFFFEHLEAVLTMRGFLNPENPRTLMRRMRRLFVKASPDHNEINILRGILTAFERANGDQR
jgi:tRNA C32,U32 (ribose-2'-O)-methylase TrmJ